MTRRIRLLEEDYEQTAVRLSTASSKLEEASKFAEESERSSIGDDASLQVKFLTSGRRIFTIGHISGGEFFTSDNVMWHRPVRLQQSRCHAVINDWMIPFATYTAAETLSAFQWAGQPPELPIPLEESRPPWCLGPIWVSPQMASRSVQPFCTARLCDQHRHTDHATSGIYSNRPHLWHAGMQCGLKLLVINLGSTFYPIVSISDWRVLFIDLLLEEISLSWCPVKSLNIFASICCFVLTNKLIDHWLEIVDYFRPTPFLCP